ncbi:mini-ribonuclease 3-like isoform X2 [Impatiens glandulifera]|uniref:mini-ribonuclease 3-like isoform X2 n=1 Tax=Impatiens glandulifera TaxID=253017 RepID=UPI001FB0766E|nr:mini-ribonuclease 3-like isoform X2 [Impatiens glandulifera]
MAAAASPILASFPTTVRVRASSWDTQPRLSYTPHRTYPKKDKDSSTAIASASSTPSRSTTIINVSPLDPTTLLLAHLNRTTSKVESEENYLGYEVWLPSPPKVDKPRSTYNAASLAYIGDCIYELYARRHFFFPPLKIEEYNDHVKAVVCAEAQDAILKKLLKEEFLSNEERDVLRWGKNIISGKTRTKKRAGSAVYNRASSLETLIGYLYLTNMSRLEEVMVQMGFSCQASASILPQLLASSIDNGK